MLGEFLPKEIRGCTDRSHIIVDRSRGSENLGRGCTDRSPTSVECSHTYKRTQAEPAPGDRRLESNGRTLAERSSGTADRSRDYEEFMSRFILHVLFELFLVISEF